MPFTFFAHQTVVLPLKAARPRWFDGTALCVGSMGPDLAYVFDHTHLKSNSHTILAQFVWTLPLATALTLLWRHALAAPFGAVLPGVLGDEVRALARARRRLWQTALGGLLGGLSHVFIDGFTHGGGWATRRIAALRHVVEIGDRREPVFHLLQYAGHVVGTLIGVIMFAVLIRRRRFSEWSAAPPSPRPAGDPVAMWIPIALGTGCAIVLGARVHDDISAAIIRAAWAGFAGICLGALIAWLRLRLRPRRRPSADRG